MFSELAAMNATVARGRCAVADINLRTADKTPWEQIAGGLATHGPLGTGKTTFARVLAAEAHLSLIATSSTDMRPGHIHAGPIAESFRRTLPEAARIAPHILALDELDGIPSREGLTSQQSGTNMIVNALLEQLDGLSRCLGTVVIATCNPDRLDPVLVRPGRLGKMNRIESADTWRSHTSLPETLKPIRSR